MADLARARRQALEENRRRKGHVPEDLYAPWNRAERWLQDDRARHAAEMLHRQGIFPDSTDRCLEIGVGSGGWLPTLLSWGVYEPSLHGLEIDPERVSLARRRFPVSHLQVGDGGKLPFVDGCFHIVVLSTVMTSILDPEVRRSVASEVQRVLVPGGALIYYDFAVNNPRNNKVRAVDRDELAALFPLLRGEVRPTTLAPPLLRFLAPWGWLWVEAAAALPRLRTHLLAVLRKDARELPVAQLPD